MFLLERLPNNRLYTSKYKPFGLLRKIDASDVSRTDVLTTGVASLDKISWGDLFYESKANGYEVYVVDDGTCIAGFVKLKVREGHSIRIDVVATDAKYQGRGVGGALLRFAETVGRSNQCVYLDLWAIGDKVAMYSDMGYAHVGETIDTGNGEGYTYMRKELLYHFALEDEHTHR